MQFRWLACALVGCGPAAHGTPPTAPAELVVAPRSGPALEVVPRSSATPADAPEAPEVGSYEEAARSASVPEKTSGAPGPQLTDAQLFAPLRDLAWIQSCGVPESTKLTVRVAIRHGAPVGVSIYTNPKDEAIDRCARHHVAALRWPDTPYLDMLTTTF